MSCSGLLSTASLSLQRTQGARCPPVTFELFVGDLQAFHYVHSGHLSDFCVFLENEKLGGNGRDVEEFFGKDWEQDVCCFSLICSRGF